MPSISRRALLTTPAVLSAQSRPSLDDTLRSSVEGHRIPAAVAAFADDRKTLYTGAFGTRNADGPSVTIDSIFAIASMTKPITTVAALQLVERGQVKLDAPAGTYLPHLGEVQVLDGYDDAGKPRLRAPKKPITLRNLLTHTSGFCYDFWDETAWEYTKRTKAQGEAPLMFDPGARWQYGTGIDWAGRIVERVSGKNLEDYFQEHILKPLEMNDTSFIAPPAKFERLVTGYQRQPDGSLTPNPRREPTPPAQFNGGGGLFSTAPDYVRFMQMILGKGRGLNGATILKPATVASMQVNQIGSSTAGKMKSFLPERSSDVDMQPGATEKWGLGFLINTTRYEGGRAAGSLAWAGLLNTYFWIDPASKRCAVILMQLLPFVDREAMGVLGDFEKAVYRRA